jgi:hypothetical protein
LLMMPCCILADPQLFTSEWQCRSSTNTAAQAVPWLVCWTRLVIDSFRIFMVHLIAIFRNRENSEFPVQFISWSAVDLQFFCLVDWGPCSTRFLLSDFLAIGHFIPSGNKTCMIKGSSLNITMVSLIRTPLV